ncbi:disease resistance protein RPV1-like isoform X2 [Helianthus annuus]|uniref:disease resistance protein RPV1-like isoform X2 n=1 Tax=Helianthus annuus TaxID=4232 RepID=UPI001652C013|nr:disease resistance protein RPV1-like isoform X2 [Helianthus annuus]
MASTSSAPDHYEYDVFLSFRGKDTRNSFTDHLYKALVQAGIRTFRDDNEIHEGQELKAKIKRSIRKSSTSIIVFSENFANSRWCLDELSLILRQKSKGDHFVLPVFYGVDPSDVRNHRGSFTVEAKEGAEGMKWTEVNVKRWKAALTEVADLKGMIVLGIPTGLTGIKTRTKVINSWLRYEQPGSPVLSICGMGGSGKTTLAKHIYYSNKQHFEGSSFLEGVEKQHDGLLGVQTQLLRDISGNNNMYISNVYEGALQIEKAMRMNRLLIVFDDIDDKDKLSALFGTKVLHTQSKIIITTRLLNIDTWSGSISWKCHVHNIELLNRHESMEVLSCHAFGSKTPMEGFEEHAVRLAHYCGGNPLAFKVLGSSLSDTTQDQWTRNDMIDAWRSRVDSLNSLEGDIDHKIQEVLQKSFESLPCDSQKELFLHIACLFVGEYASHVERILENDYHAKSGMMTLTNRCLLTVSSDGLRLVVHKLLQDMSRKIVRNESRDPAKHSRVWRHDEYLIVC